MSGGPLACLKSGNVAVITGGSSGIGRAMGRHAAKLGMKVVLADVDEANLKEAEAELKGIAADTSHVMGVVTDVSDPKSIEALKDAAYGAYGAVHLLMNNAGIDGGRQGPLAPRANWERTLGVNMWGVISGCQSFVPNMQKQNTPGLIINTGSKQGITAPPGNLAYNVSKSAVKAYTEGLQHELRSTEDNQLQAVLLVPGWTNTSIAIKTKKFDAADQGETFDESTVFFSEAKPQSGAWMPHQVVDFLLERLNKNPDAFYIICPDNDVTVDVDNARMTWAMQDVTEDRPPLSRWHADFTPKFNEYLVAKNLK